MSVTPYVDQFYEMNPQFDDLIYGSDLREGMVVLVADPLQRVDPAEASRRSVDDDAIGRHLAARCKEVNRWCTVARLSPRDGHEAFIGEYADGTKRLRHFAPQQPWLVKRITVGGVA